MPAKARTALGMGFDDGADAVCVGGMVGLEERSQLFA